MYIIHRATCCVWRQEDAQLATERVRDLSNNAAVVTESPNATPSDSKVVVGTSSTIARENNGTGPTKLTNGCDNGANTCSRCRNVSCLCQDAAALRCRQHYLADDTETVVCPPLSVDSRRDMTYGTVHQSERVTSRTVSWSTLERSWGKTTTRRVRQHQAATTPETCATRSMRYFFLRTATETSTRPLNDAFHSSN